MLALTYVERRACVGPCSSSCRCSHAELCVRTPWRAKGWTPPYAYTRMCGASVAVAGVFLAAVVVVVVVVVVVIVTHPRIGRPLRYRRWRRHTGITLAVVVIAVGIDNVNVAGAAVDIAVSFPSSSSPTTALSTRS